eukprot:2288520-Prorocentrum_lima.AAC.1
MRAIASTSPDVHAAFLWFTEVQQPGMTVEHIVGGMEDHFMRIDQKVAPAILAVCEKYQGKEHGVR